MHTWLLRSSIVDFAPVVTIHAMKYDVLLWQTRNRHPILLFCELHTLHSFGQDEPIGAIVYDLRKAHIT
jgi:hypothetical protein